MRHHPLKYVIATSAIAAALFVLPGATGLRAAPLRPTHSPASGQSSVPATRSSPAASANQAVTAGTCSNSTASTDWLLASASPSPNFDPMTATNAQLMANGYPPEPSASDPSGVEAWQNAVSHAISWSSPAPVYICDTSGSSIYNGVWAGHLANTSAYGNINFLETYSVWTQHSVPTDPNYDDDDYSLAPAVSS